MEESPHSPQFVYTHTHNHPHISRTFPPARNIMKFWFTCLPAICGQQHVNSICCCYSAFSFPTNTAVRLANRTWVKLDLKSLLPCQGRHWIRIDWHFILLQSVVVISFISFRWRFWPWSASGVRSSTGKTYNLYYDNIARLQKMQCNTWFWDDRRNCEEGKGFHCWKMWEGNNGLYSRLYKLGWAKQHIIVPAVWRASHLFTSYARWFQNWIWDDKVGFALHW